MVDGHRVVRGTVVVIEEYRKGHSVGCRCRQSDGDVHAATRTAHKTLDFWRSEVQLGTVDATTDLAGSEKDATFDVFDG